MAASLPLDDSLRKRADVAAFLLSTAAPSTLNGTPFPSAQLCPDILDRGQAHAAHQRAPCLGTVLAEQTGRRQSKGKVAVRRTVCGCGGPCHCGRWQYNTSKSLNNCLAPDGRTFRVRWELQRWMVWCEDEHKFIAGDYKAYTYSIEEPLPSQAAPHRNKEFDAWLKRLQWESTDEDGGVTRTVLCQTFFDPITRVGPKRSAREAEQSSPQLQKRGKPLDSLQPRLTSPAASPPSSASSVSTSPGLALTSSDETLTSPGQTLSSTAVPGPCPQQPFSLAAAPGASPSAPLSPSAALPVPCTPLERRLAGVLEQHRDSLAQRSQKAQGHLDTDPWGAPTPAFVTGVPAPVEQGLAAEPGALEVGGWVSDLWQDVDLTTVPATVQQGLAAEPGSLEVGGGATDPSQDEDLNLTGIPAPAFEQCLAAGLHCPNSAPGASEPPDDEHLGWADDLAAAVEQGLAAGLGSLAVWGVVSDRPGDEDFGLAYHQGALSDDYIPPVAGATEVPAGGGEEGFAAELGSLTGWGCDPSEDVAWDLEALMGGGGEFGGLFEGP